MVRVKPFLFHIVVFLIGVVSMFFIVMTHQTDTVAPTEVTDVSDPAFVLEAAQPQTIRIPAVDIEAPFSAPLGLTATNESEVPDDYESVGWYKFGPTPGELGPAVVLGHVDSYTGPAVFFRLGQLAVGDEIYIDRADGTTTTFVVTELERPRQNEFPTARVYGDIDHAGLRLITCSGTFVRGEQRYTHNLIVYARLVDSPPRPTSN